MTRREKIQRMSRVDYKSMQRKRLVKIRDEARQQVTDIESWNENRTDAAPFDLGSALVTVKLAQEGIDAIDRDDLKAFDAVSAKMLEHCRLAAGSDGEGMT